MWYVLSGIWLLVPVTFSYHKLCFSNTYFLLTHHPVAANRCSYRKGFSRNLSLIMGGLKRLLSLCDSANVEEFRCHGWWTLSVIIHVCLPQVSMCGVFPSPTGSFWHNQPRFQQSSSTPVPSHQTIQSTNHNLVLLIYVCQCFLLFGERGAVFERFVILMFLLGFFFAQYPFCPT